MRGHAGGGDQGSAVNGERPPHLLLHPGVGREVAWSGGSEALETVAACRKAVNVGRGESPDYWIGTWRARRQNSAGDEKQPRRALQKQVIVKAVPWSPGARGAVKWNADCLPRFSVIGVDALRKTAGVRAGALLAQEGTVVQARSSRDEKVACRKGRAWRTMKNRPGGNTRNHWENTTRVNARRTSDEPTWLLHLRGRVRYEPASRQTKSQIRSLCIHEIEQDSVSKKKYEEKDFTARCRKAAAAGYGEHWLQPRWAAVEVAGS
ncbi:hypothetical protein K438DRAFT_1784833 [Mycena galopus ATCC 62051]|nr:hypothetical protein K438DRAFT_1784833 [Mycena galopus ATCC 62051]